MKDPALVVGTLAVSAALINALASLFNFWRDNRGLDIALRADPWGAFEHLRREAGFVLEVTNRARTPNWIAEVKCRVDSKPLRLLFEPQDFVDRQVKPFSASRAALRLPKGEPSDALRRVEIVVVPVRGRRRRFRFAKQEILPEF